MTSRKDAEIIKSLRMNSRESTAGISRRTGIPVQTIMERIQKLESNGIIKGYVSLVDFSKLGYWIRVCYLIRAGSKRESLEEFLLESQHINNLQRIRGGFDLFAEAIFANLRELEEFQEALMRLGAEEVEGHHILSEEKFENFQIDV